MVAVVASLQLFFFPENLADGCYMHGKAVLCGLAWQSEALNNLMQPCIHVISLWVEWNWVSGTFYDSIHKLKVFFFGSDRTLVIGGKDERYSNSVDFT